MVSVIHLTESAITLGIFGWGFIGGFSWIWLLCGIVSIAVSIFCMPDDLWLDYNDKLKVARFATFVLMPVVCSWYLISGFSAAWLLCAIYAALRCYNDIDFLLAHKKWENEDSSHKDARIATANQLESQILDGTVTDVMGPYPGVGFQKIVPRHKKYARYYALCAAWEKYIKPYGIPLPVKEIGQKRERLDKKHPVSVLGIELGIVCTSRLLKLK